MGNRLIHRNLTLYKSGRGLEHTAPVLRPLLDALTLYLIQSGEGTRETFTEHAGGVDLGGVEGVRGKDEG